VPCPRGLERERDDPGEDESDAEPLHGAGTRPCVASTASGTSGDAAEIGPTIPIAPSASSDATCG